jgi:hypothetical protein
MWTPVICVQLRGVAFQFSAHLAAKQISAEDFQA